jgi:hypothetical protein
MTSPSPQPSFQQSLAITGQWLELWENGELSDEVLADRVAELVVNRDGGRGFFAVSLAGDSPLLDRLPEPLVLALRAVGAPVVDLCLRNLAMSTAMALHHARSGDPQQQAGSERVASRCTDTGAPGAWIVSCGVSATAAKRRLSVCTLLALLPLLPSMAVARSVSVSSPLCLLAFVSA